MTTVSARPSASTATPPQGAAESDAALVERAKAGDRAACEALLDRWFDRVSAVAMARLRHPEAAEDLTQEVFLRAWLKLGDLRDGDRFGGWLMRMTQNLSLMWRRSGARRSKLVQMVPWEDAMPAVTDDTITAAPDEISRREETDALRRALDKLDDGERELIRLHYENELSQRDTARELGVHHTTIGRRLSGVLDKLRGTMSADELRESSGVMREASRRQARRRASAVVVGLSAMSGAVRDGVASTAAASSPTSAGIAAAQVAVATAQGVGFMKTTATSISAGVAIMTTAQKITAAIILTVTAAATGWYAVGGEASPAKPDFKARERLESLSFDPDSPDASSVLSTNEETVTMIPFGTSVALDVPGPNSAEARHIVAYAHPDGYLEAQVLTTSGKTNLFRLNPSSLEPGADIIWTNLQLWEEKDRFLFESLYLEKTATGMQITMWRQNRPDLLPKHVALQKAVRSGETDPKDAVDLMWKLITKEGVVPESGANRTLLENLYRGGFHY